MKTIRMPKELLAKWLAALRSDEIEQARGKLYDEKSGGYCCLGVLVKVSEDYPPTELERGTPSQKFMFTHGILFDALAVEVGGADPGNPYLPSLGTHAANANDGGKTFAEIADAIEACAEGV